MRFKAGETDIRSRTGGSMLVWHWYYVGGRYTASRYTAKMLQVWGLLRGETISGVIAVAVDYKTADSGVRRHLEKFIREHEPEIRSAFETIKLNQ